MNDLLAELLEALEAILPYAESEIENLQEIERKQNAGLEEEIDEAETALNLAYSVIEKATKKGN